MEDIQPSNLPNRCPACEGELVATKLQCTNCGTEVDGTFALGRLSSLREPHASLLEMFLRVRGNVKELERELGLSYPTVRARLEEALEAAGFPREPSRGSERAEPWEDRWTADLTERINARVEEKLTRLGILSQQGMNRAEAQARRESESAAERADIVRRLEDGEISAAEAAQALRDLKKAR